ncbi:NAD(P)H azoreductase [Nocardia otitidiscaviarum]|uniref:NAD(P)H azoreductase n=1 Tax=Nocardia otitidiscaviarum TaxID=1823 RepID=A0A378YQ36_9NOCA|nr:NmrA family NAD(P)-binding protein [Nocardia otitidiscaviarum]SUA79315.1 NAD(P)H azoreductase [Nocardia otitidiscaviarum]
MEPILVTGAAGGTQGSTGRRVVAALRRADRPVRAFVRADDARAAELRELGAEVAVGDLREITTVFAAIGSGHQLYRVTEAIADIGGRPPLTLREHVAHRLDA